MALLKKISNNQSGLTGYMHFATTEEPSPWRENECAYFYYDNLPLILWLTASVLCFFALISTIHTIYRAYQLWSTVQELENSIIDLIDESCQILLPMGVCKQICHPHHIGTVNANYLPKGQKQEQKPGRKENRYPEDVTFPPSDIENVYDVMGDEDARKSKTITLQSMMVNDEKKELNRVRSRELQLQQTPAMESRESLGSREPTSDKSAVQQKKPVFAKTQTNKTPTREAQPQTARSRESTTPKRKLREAKRPTSVGMTPNRSSEPVTPRNMSRESARKAMEKSAQPASTQNE